MSIDETQAGKSLKRYYWLAFVIAGMVVGFAGCLAYSYITEGSHSLLGIAVADNLKTVDESIVQAALPAAEAVSLSVFLGVEIVSVDAVIAEQFGLPKACGVLVNNVVDKSPADKAGLQRSDVILSVNNIAVEDVDGFREIMAQLNPGDNVRIIYIRGGQKDTTYATLANLSAAAAIAEDGNDTDWGVSLSVLSSDLRTSLRIPANIDGIVILSVMPGGLADEAGLQEGDVITGIDNTPIVSMSDFFEAITVGDDNIALLDIYSKGQLRFVALDSSAVAAVARQRQTSLLDRIISIFTDDDNVILTEHINEEDDYEKPVCKRLEESGERYDQ
ncbi:MAG: PDZ domain-containing protein [Planctomycetes bacterium]|nr:PDZ domain-containing protein [Planctomycetota bacterium]